MRDMLGSLVQSNPLYNRKGRIEGKQPKVNRALACAAKLFFYRVGSERKSQVTRETEQFN